MAVLAIEFPFLRFPDSAHQGMAELFRLSRMAGRADLGADIGGIHGGARLRSTRYGAIAWCRGWLGGLCGKTALTQEIEQTVRVCQFRQIRGRRLLRGADAFAERGEGCDRGVGRIIPREIIWLVIDLLNEIAQRRYGAGLRIAFGIRGRNQENDCRNEDQRSSGDAHPAAAPLITGTKKQSRTQPLRKHSPTPERILIRNSLGSRAEQARFTKKLAACCIPAICGK